MLHRPVLFHSLQCLLLQLFTKLQELYTLWRMQRLTGSQTQWLCHLSHLLKERLRFQRSPSHLRLTNLEVLLKQTSLQVLLKAASLMEIPVVQRRQVLSASPWRLGSLFWASSSQVPCCKLLYWCFSSIPHPISLFLLLFLCPFVDCLSIYCNDFITTISHEAFDIWSSGMQFHSKSDSQLS